MYTCYDLHFVVALKFFNVSFLSYLSFGWLVGRLVGWLVG